MISPERIPSLREPQEEESSDSSFFDPESSHTEVFNVFKGLMEAVKAITDARKKHGDNVRVEIPGAAHGFHNLVTVSYPEPASLE